VGGHPGTKRLPCLTCFSELPVQPYDNMGSVLIEYIVRVHSWVLTEGGILGTVRSGWLNAPSEMSCLILLSG
jgi:hypothetical protein